MNIELHQLALQHVESKFNVLIKLNARDFDCNWSVLLDQLEQIKRDQFSSRDRVLICHMDTDYYDPLLPVGTIVNNLIRCFQQLNIPLYLLLFVTNHYGISREFDLLLANQHASDCPTIVETLLSPVLLSQSQYDQTVNPAVGCVEKPGLCMMGAQRSHRAALLKFFQTHGLLDRIAISANFATHA